MPDGDDEDTTPQRTEGLAGTITDVRRVGEEEWEFHIAAREAVRSGWYTARKLRRATALTAQVLKWEKALKAGCDAVKELKASAKAQLEEATPTPPVKVLPAGRSTSISETLALNETQMIGKAGGEDHYGLSLLPIIGKLVGQDEDGSDASVPPAFKCYHARSAEDRGALMQAYVRSYTAKPGQRPFNTLHLVKHYEQLFGSWISDLSAGNSVLLQGYGSKAPVLHAFGRAPLFRQPNTLVVFVCGAQPRISCKLIMNALCSCVVGDKAAGAARRSMTRQLAFLQQLLGESEGLNRAAAREAINACASLPEARVSAHPLAVARTADEAERSTTPTFNNRDDSDTQGEAGDEIERPEGAPARRSTRSQTQTKRPEGVCRMAMDMVNFQRALHRAEGMVPADKEVEHLGGVMTRGFIDASKPNPRVLLCIASIDHDYLWLPSAQDFLASLAAVPRVWLVAAVDKVNSCAALKRRDADRIQFVCYHTPTFLPFPPGYRLMKGSAALLYGGAGNEEEGDDDQPGDYRGVRAVLSCITSRSRKVLRLVVEYQAARQQPMPEQDLLAQATKAMLALNYSQLQNFLKECIDHRLVVMLFERSGNVYRVLRHNAVRQALDMSE